ncbi:OprD family outer membrane porin [Pseudomonas sp. AL03]|nr:OprD family outer membrane porin [Pseudomonas sp. AL03]MDI3271636.1 OprD family outer membrane porin [Pseudomonas sp. AL03]
MGRWAGELEDVYTQKLITGAKFVDVVACNLSGPLNYTDTGEQGSALVGPLDSLLTSALVSAAYGMHIVTVGCQYNARENALPFLQETDLSAVGYAIASQSSLNTAVLRHQICGKT